MIKHSRLLKVFTDITMEPILIPDVNALRIDAHGPLINIYRDGVLLVQSSFEARLSISNVEGPSTGIIICDRCKDEVGPKSGQDEITAGYYDVSGGGWGHYANAGEEHICDHCMWHDERYRNVYGKVQCKCKKCTCECQH